jgi:hypothetical protein
MEQKVIQLQFNRVLFTNRQKNLWKFAMRNSLKQYLYMSIATVICTLVVFSTENKNEFSFGKMLSSGFIIYMTLVWVSLIERWIKHYKKIKIISDRFEKEGMDFSYIFNDYGIVYEDKEKFMKLSWQLFKPFEAYKDNIYIKAKDTGAIVFHLSRQELGDSDYQEVYALLENKIG